MVYLYIPYVCHMRHIWGIYVACMWHVCGVYVAYRVFQITICQPKEGRHREHHFDVGHLGSETCPKAARALSSLRLKVGSPHGTLAEKAMEFCHFSGLWLPTWALVPRHDDKDPTLQCNVDPTWRCGPNMAT